ncbi:hypothetical protein [Nocardioides sp.]|uniref:hypothetical protein n=1 Tax=Nocardioides sp. TaxID=35761 RepID=UPI00321A12DA
MTRLPVLSDFRRGLERLPHDTELNAVLDKPELHARIDQIAAIKTFLGPRASEAQMVLAAAQAVLATCAKFALPTPKASARWAVETLCSWLSGSSWTLALDPQADGGLVDRYTSGGDPDSEPFLSGLATWLKTRIVHRATGRLVTGAMYDASGTTKLLFISTRISNTGAGEELRLATKHSQVVADTAYAVGGFRCHQTVVHADPRLRTSHHPGWRESDEEVIAMADGVILVWDAPADGFGVVAELARRYSVPIVIVKVGQGRLSPMLLGDDGQRPLVLPGETYKDELLEVLTEDRLGLAVHQQRRLAAEERAALDLEDLQRAISTLSDEALSDRAMADDAQRLTPTRFRRLIHSPRMWRGATGEERDLVRRLAGWTPPLDYAEARALAKVHDTLLLSSNDALRLEHAGRREKAAASAGRARFAATEPEAWIHLFRKYLQQ